MGDTIGANLGDDSANSNIGKNNTQFVINNEHSTPPHDYELRIERIEIAVESLAAIQKESTIVQTETSKDVRDLIIVVAGERANPWSEVRANGLLQKMTALESWYVETKNLPVRVKLIMWATVVNFVLVVAVAVYVFSSMSALAAVSVATPVEPAIHEANSNRLR